MNAIILKGPSKGEQSFIFHCKIAGLSPHGEWKFHPKRRWRFDFAWPDEMIAVEIEGGVYSRGRHTRGAGYISDMEKYNEAQRMGWQVYRFTTDQAVSGEATRFVAGVLADAQRSASRKSEA